MELNCVGTWQLERFDISRPSGQYQPWGSSAGGLLIYTPSGHVSVAINRTVEATGNADGDVLRSILFYAGTYHTEGSIIRHVVTNASNPDRIGRELIRYAELRDGVLTLTTSQEPYGTARLVWRKIG